MHWQDHTAAVPDLSGFTLTKLYLTTDYAFMDDDTRSHHDAALESFKARNNRDLFQDYSNRAIVAELAARTLCFVDRSGPPVWVNGWAYFLAAVLMLSLPYRFVLDQQLATLNHKVMKKVGR